MPKDTTPKAAAKAVCPVTGANLQYGQNIADQWHWDDESQQAVCSPMAVPQVIRHEPTLPFIRWMRSLFYDKNRKMTAERRNVIQRALSEGNFTETNDLAVISGGENPCLLNFHHRGLEVSKFIEAGNKLETAISVLYGLPFRSIAYFDTGKNRSTTQIATIMDRSIPIRSVPLVNVLVEMLADTKILSPDERIRAIQAIEPQITQARTLLGSNRRLQSPVVEAAFVSAICDLQKQPDYEIKLNQLGLLVEAVESQLTDADTDTAEPTTEAGTEEDRIESIAIAIVSRLNIYEKGKKNGSERTELFKLLGEGIYRYLKGERFKKLMPKRRSFSAYYPLPEQITDVTGIPSNISDDDEVVVVADAVEVEVGVG